MTSRIIGCVLLPCLVIALLLSFVGVRQVEFGDTYYVFMSNVAHDFEGWSISIPDIPKIPEIKSGGFDDGGLILSVLIKIGNFFVSMFNALILVLNVIILVLNTLIQLIQFCLTLIFELINFRDSFTAVSFMV